MVTENRWLKLSMVTDPCLVEPLADFLVGVLDAGVETGAVDDPLFGTVNAYIRQANPDQAMIAATVSQLSAYLDELAEIFVVPAPELSWTLIEQEDWGRNWKAFFQPFTIVPGLVIAPHSAQAITPPPVFVWKRSAAGCRNIPGPGCLMWVPAPEFLGWRRHFSVPRR